MGSLGLAGLAGVLASLSPCVLPLLPIVLAAAIAEHRLGPLALAGGLALSFAAIGVALSLVGFAIGFDGEWLRLGAGLLMLLAGAALLAAGLGARFAVAAERAVAPVAAYAQRLSARGIGGQFALGAVLGLAWAPCTGPALGGAVALAAQASSAPAAATTMAVFAVGASVPLLVLGYAARGSLPGLRRRLASAGHGMQKPLGGTLVLFGLLVLTGLDKTFETWATASMPQAWVRFVVQF